MIRVVFSEQLKKNIPVEDDCGCRTGGFYEKEFTQHGFNGNVWVIAHKIYCGICHKQLKPTFKQFIQDYE